MEAFYKLIVDNLNSGKIDKQTAIAMLQTLKDEEKKGENAGDEIAVIGLAARFANAENAEEYWNQIRNGIDMIRELPAARKADLDEYFRSKGQESLGYQEAAYLEEIDKFDYSFFGFSPKEASSMDPNQRLYLETVWKAIEDAGYGGEKLVGSNTGVYVGFSGVLGENYADMLNSQDEYNASSIIGNLASILPSRLSYLLDLQGPSLVVDTACSSSLVSIALACQALRNGSCDMAIASGVKVNVLPIINEKERIGFESSDGRTRAFDSYSDGAGIGEGAGAVLLKPLKQALKDGDQVHAVIKGFAMNQDGASMGITAPNPAMQTQVILKAWEDAKIDPETISYIETHGTGTVLGDPIEIQGIQNAFRKFTDNTQFVALSSVKTNIGHLYDASGIANFIKTIMALKHHQLPPSHYFNRPNKNIRFTDSPVYINTKVREWKTNGTPRRCGISAFGLSGTNCHIVLEEAPEIARDDSSITNWEVLSLSAKNSQSLQELVSAFQNVLASAGKRSLADICYTANTGRGQYNYRLALIGQTHEEMLVQLNRFAPDDLGSFAGYYGHHKVVTLREGREDLLSEEEQAELTSQALHLVEQLQNSTGADSVKLLQQLCELYVKGATVNWDALYRDETRYKVSLPTYPFERKRAWLQFSTTPKQAIQHPLENQLLYGVTWKEKALPPTPAYVVDRGTVLVFKDELAFGDQMITRLRRENRRVIEVSHGTAFAKEGEDAYIVGDRESDYNQLFADLVKAGLSQIVHLFANKGTTNITDVTQLVQSQKKGLYSLFYVIRAIINNNVRDNLDIVLISNHVHQVTKQEPYLQPQAASMFGLGKAAAQEYPSIRCRSLDLDLTADLEQVLAEIQTPTENYVVAYREGKRYVEQLGEVNLERVPDRQVELKEDGVYLVTGGTGGVGLAIAKHMATKQKVTFAFVNRTPMSAREHWDEILAKQTDAATIQKIESIQEIEAMGAKVVCYTGNVSDLAEMEKLLATIRAEHGKLNGVIHSAGMVGNGYIVRRDHELFDQVIAPKVHGTWILDHLTAHDDLDFFIMFSSVAAIFGEAGQADYVAANTFLNAYADYRNQRSKNTLTIEWFAWKSVGTAVTYGFNRDILFKATPTEQATDSFDQALRKNISRVLVGELNVKSDEHMPVIEKFRVDLSPQVNKALQESKQRIERQHASNEPQQKQADKGEVRLTGKKEAEYSEVEKSVARIYREILGFEEIDIYDSFFELGGDSVMLNLMHAQLEKDYPGKVKTVDLFVHTSVAKLAQFISESIDAFSKPIAANREEKRGEKQTPLDREQDIAIIGMSMNMPMAKNAKEYWENIRSGVECVKEFPAHRKADADRYFYFSEGIEFDSIKYLSGSYLDDVDKFDYEFFRMTPNEANLTDPHQRLFMQTVWNAVEDAGYGGGKLVGTNTGVYMGYANHVHDAYSKMIFDVDPEMFPLSAVGNYSSMMPTRISYLLNLTGPTMVIDTACSSAMVATHTACQAIRNGDCEMAIVGGVRVMIRPIDAKYLQIGIESSNSKTMTFDFTADGSGVGEGVSAVVLKPLSKALEDGDNVYAVIKGSAINQDGKSMSISAPNPEAQADVLDKAWSSTGTDPETLAFIEAHGTATSLGDPIEIDGLQKAFERYTDKKQFCAIGSVKTNIGHLFECAGMASLMKATLALKHGEIPPSLNFNRPNAKVQFEDSPIYVNTKLRKWNEENGPMRGAISSFGFSGTNCHLILEQAPVVTRAKQTGAGLQVLALSARTETALETLLDSYIERVQEEPKLNSVDMCFTANTRRDHHKQRFAIVLETGDNLLERLLEAKAQFTTTRQNLQSIETLDLNGEAATKLQQFISSGQASKGLLHELAELYMLGATIRWDALYEGVNVRKVSLPGYPFEGKRCWVNVPEGVSKVRTVQTQADESDKFFSMVWKEKALDKVSAETPHQAVMIFMDDKGIGEDLAQKYRQSGITVVQVRWGDSFGKEDHEHYMISGQEQDYIDLFTDCKLPITQILHMSLVIDRDDINSVEELQQTQLRGAYSLFYLTRALTRCEVIQEIDIVLIAECANEVSGAEESLKPEHATLFGLGKVVRREHLNLLCRAIDIDRDVTAEQLDLEIRVVSDEYQVAYRQQKRYVEMFTEIALEQVPDRGIEIKANGVYVITGGTGGIGLETAKYLAAQQPVQLVMINRSTLPQREQWAEILENGQAGLVEKIRGIQELEAMGSKVACYSADVANFEQMEGVFREVRHHFGKIDGVVHGAGLATAELIVARSNDDVASVMSPKIEGTWVIDRLTREDDLDFFVMYSSIATFFSAAAQGDYTAANAYLDAFTSYRNKQGKNTLTVNWSTWKETGMAVRHNFTFDTLFKAIRSEEAIECLALALHKDIPRALIGELNDKMISLLDKYMFGLSEKLRTQLNAKKKAVQGSRISNEGSTNLETSFAENGEGEYSETQRNIVQICKRILGFDALNMQDNFFELGADSIILTQMHANIEKLYPGIVAMPDMFEYTSVCTLVQYIDSKRNTEETFVPKHVKDEENLDAELRKIFDGLGSDDTDLDEVLKNITKL